MIASHTPQCRRHRPSAKRDRRGVWGPRARGRGSSPSDAGQATAFLVIVIAGLAIVLGLVVDGGLALRSKVQAIDEAQEAARAGAQHINLVTYRTTGKVVLLPDEAATAARTYLQATGNPDASQAQITVNGNEVSVSVTRHQSTQVLSIAGLHGINVHGSATVTAELGITGPQD